MPTPPMTPEAQAAYEEALRRIEECRLQGDLGTVLNLRGLGLTEVPIEIGRLSAVRELYLSNNKLASLPPEIGQIRKLTGLSLHNNALTCLPPEIGQLSLLKGLYLSDNIITRLPPEIGKLVELTVIQIHNNQLTSLPSELCDLTNLVRIDLGNNRIKKLPHQIGRLIALKELNLDNNQLVSLPPEIGQMSALTVIQLRNNLLRELQPETCQLAELTRLDVGTNHITRLPHEIGLLSRLKELNLDSNQLTSITPEVGQLSALSKLNLSHNFLTSLPREIAQFCSLNEFHLSNNQLVALPPEIGRLSNLRRIELNNNQLSSIPPEIGQLSTLRSLNLTNNQLVSLPPEIGHLKSLERLWLENNALERLPETLKGLKSLKEFTVHGNDALGLPVEILGPSSSDSIGKDRLAKPHDIIEYFFRVHSANASRPLLEAKVILVGWGAVGKTSLRRRLVDGGFDQAEKKTHKIEITPWQVQVGQDAVKLNVWDFGGQEIMHATHQFFLTKRSLYVLVLAGREKVQGAQEAEYWLRLIASFGGESPVLVVLNKQAQCAFDLNRQSLMEKYPFIRGFVQTDCVTELGLLELKLRILAEVDKLPELRTKFDTRWIAIKDAVSNLRQNGRHRLSVEEFQSLCLTYHEGELKWQKWLLGFLHDLGIVICFHDDPRLANDGVLDPQWLVDGIYTILNEPKLKGGDGLITRQQVRDLLPVADYSDDDLRVLLEMMEKFELCFPPNGSRTALVVPELMTEQEASWKEHFPKLAECLRFELHYEFLPEGLLPRFIVATHYLSAEGERWRTGVILRRYGNIALVRGDSVARRVHIAVNGPESTRRDLLSIIRQEFATIHARISRLGVKEMIPVPGSLELLLDYSHLITLEQAGMQSYHAVDDGQVFRISISSLLSGVEERHTLQRNDQREREIISIVGSKVLTADEIGVLEEAQLDLGFIENITMEEPSK